MTGVYHQTSISSPAAQALQKAVNLGCDLSGEQILQGDTREIILAASARVTAKYSR